MLSEYFEVIIPDLPSYGFSETIPQKVVQLNQDGKTNKNWCNKHF